MANSIRETQKLRRKLQLEINDLSGGFVSQAATYDIDERFLEDIQNMELIQGMWQKRKGFHLSGTFTAIDPVPGQIRGSHIFNNEGNLHLLTICGTDLYDTRQLTKMTSSGKVFANRIPSSPHISFADFRNECYIAYGQGNVLRFDGANLKDVSSPDGSILTVYDNRLLLSGIKGDPLVIYFSDRGKGTEWDALNYIVLDGKSGEKITAMIPMLGKLYIFTNHAIYSLVGSMENFSVSLEVSGVGAISSKAIYTMGNLFYFISSDRKIYEFDGGNFPHEISLNISHYIKSKFTQKALEQAVITHYKDAVWFTMDDSYVPSERTTLVYYPSYQAWTRFKGIPAASYVYVGDTMYFIGVHNVGSIYQYGSLYNDDASAIDAYIRTTKWKFDLLENLKRFKIMYLRGAIQGGGGNGFDIEFWIDESKVASLRATSDIASETELWGSNSWGSMYWGHAAETSGAVWGQMVWSESEWNGAEPKYSPKWGGSTWNAFKWGDQKEGSLIDDVSNVYRKIFLSQYNIILGKTLQLVFRDRTPHHGFRFERMVLEYIQKGAR